MRKKGNLQDLSKVPLRTYMDPKGQLHRCEIRIKITKMR